MKTIKWIVLLIGVISLSVTAETLKIYASKDAYTDSWFPNDNQGGMVSATLGRESGHQCDLYLYFPLGSLPDNAIVDDAVIKLHVNLFIGEFTSQTKYVGLA